MEAASRNAPAAVIQRLCEEPGRFGFFQAVRVLEAAQRQARKAADSCDEARVGAPEVVRFRVPPSLRFPESEVIAVSVRDGAPGAAFEMSVDCLGLIGVVGTLPQHYTELILERLHVRDRTLLEFLDLFQHRALTLFYRAWRKYRFAFEAEARENDCRDTFSRAMLSLAGFGLERSRGRLSLADGSLAFLAGHMGHRPRSAVGLAGLLSEYYGAPCHVEQFVGHWLDVPERERSKLTSHSTLTGALGQGFLVGSRVWDVGSKVRVHFGPITAQEIVMLIPGEPGHERLSELVWSYLGPGMDCELVVEPSPGAATGFRLGTNDARLGRNTWFSSASGRLAPATLALSRPMNA